MSASCCEHGANQAKYVSAGEQRTPLLFGAHTSLPSAKSVKGRRIASPGSKANTIIMLRIENGPQSGLSVASSILC